MVLALTLSAAFLLQFWQVEIRATHEEGQSHICLMGRLGVALETYLHCPPAHFIDGDCGPEWSRNGLKAQSYRPEPVSAQEGKIE